MAISLASRILHAALGIGDRAAKRVTVDPGLALLERYRGRIRDFISGPDSPLGGEVVPPASEIVDALERGDRKLLCPAAQAQGKSDLMARLIVAFTFPEALGPPDDRRDGRWHGSLVMLTGPKRDQVYANLVSKHLRKYLNRLEGWLQQLLQDPAYRLPLRRFAGGDCIGSAKNDSLILSLEHLSPGWAVRLVVPGKAEGAAHKGAGHHHDYLLVCMGEEIVDAPESTLTMAYGWLSNDADVLLWVYNTYEGADGQRRNTLLRFVQSRPIRTLRLSGLHHPNITGRGPHIRGCKTIKMLLEDALAWKHPGRAHGQCEVVGTVPGGAAG